MFQKGTLGGIIGCVSVSSLGGSFLSAGIEFREVFCEEIMEVVWGEILEIPTPGGCSWWNSRHKFPEVL